MEDETLFQTETFTTTKGGTVADVEKATLSLAGYFVDAARAFRGEDPPAKVTKRIGMEAKKLLLEGIDVEHVKKGIQILADRGADPSMLPECVFQAQARPDTPVGPDRIKKKETNEELNAFLEEHGGKWPTGAKMVRGTHAATLVYDPLGYEPVPAYFDTDGSGIHRPTRAEVIAALERS